MESLEEILRKTKENAKRVVFTVTAISLIGISAFSFAYYKKQEKINLEKERREWYEERLLHFLGTMPPQLKNYTDAFRYLMYKMYHQKDDISIILATLFCPVRDTYPDIVVLVPHKKGTGLLYLFIMDERRKEDTWLYDCQDDEHKTKMIRLISIDENLDDKTRRSLLYNSIDYLIFEAKKFYNEE
ncbi:MAG: hypothetical protein QXU20_02935 [Candidatus Woesearchaeota archaeon]